MSTKITYNIDKENRIITASMDECTFDAYVNLEKINSDVGLLIDFFDLAWDDFSMKRVYTGIAKCHPEDEWDEEMGKELARARLLKKYYKDYTDIIKQIIMKIDYLASGIREKYYYGIERYNMFVFLEGINR